MNVTYRDVDFDSEEDCRLLSRWHNDGEIRHFINCFPKEDSPVQFRTPGAVRARKNKLPKNRPYSFLMVLMDKEPVGYASFEIDPPYLATGETRTAWMAIVLGKNEARGRGLGCMVMKHLEGLAKEMGAKRAEIGVFEFNTRAIHLCQKLGYQEVERILGFTYWDGRKWSDIRMVKSLVQGKPVRN